MKKSVGHPAKQDPDVAKLFKAMKSAVELVRDVGPRLGEENELILKASALGLMSAYSEMTGMPSPFHVATPPKL